MSNQLQGASPAILFYCYASADEQLQLPLEKHLSLLQQRGIITSWHPRQIEVGTNRKQAIDNALSAASLILLLISPDFIASDYCYGFEMAQAMERYQRGEARVIPVLLRPVADWSVAPFGRLSALPSNAKPVTRWSNRDAAFENVVNGIKKVIEEWFSPKTIGEWLDTCKELSDQNCHEDALWAVQQALRIDPDDIYANLLKCGLFGLMGYYEETLAALNHLLEGSPDCMAAYEGKIRVLIDTGRYEEALEICNQAQEHDPLFAAIYHLKAMILARLGRYEETLTVAQQHIHLAGDNAEAYETLCTALLELGKLEEAQQAYERAMNLDPNNPQLYHLKGRILWGRGQLEAALLAYEELTILDPRVAFAFYLKAKILYDLNRSEEAVVACRQALHLGLDTDFHTADAKADVYQTMVNALLRLHRWGETLLACSEIIHLQPNNAEAYEIKALALTYAGRSKEALDACEQAIQLGLTMPTSTYYLMGEALYTFGRYEEALDAYEQVLHLDPDHPWASKGKEKALRVLRRT